MNERVMLKYIARVVLFTAFVLVLTLAKEIVIVAMSATRIDSYLPTSWLPHAPYVVLAVVVFPVVAWLFAKLFRIRTIALSVGCSLLLLAGPLMYLYDSVAGDNLFLILANAGLALAFVFWVIVFVRLGASVSKG